MGETYDYRLASDEELWSLVGGEHAGTAFSELFDRHADRVYAHCYRRTGSWSMAEDLTSVVFLEAWRRRGHVRFSGDSLLPWLLGVANNATRNAQRSIRRHQLMLTKLPPPGIEADIAADAIERVDHEHQVRELLQAMRGLTQADRDVLSICDVANLSYADAAVALNIPEGTVRSRLSRARERLRAKARSANLIQVPHADPAGGKL